MIAYVKDIIKAVRERRAKRTALLERAAIAKAFNDLYTYRKPYRKNMPDLPGSYYLMPHSSGYAWMCPNCNTIHHPHTDSMFSGLQYPGCCQYGAGHRLHEGIRTRQ